MSLHSRFSSALFFIIVFSCVQTGWAISLDVPSAGCPTIQSAVEMASDGDVVEVVHGTYVEDIVINGDVAITLHSNPGAKIKGSITVENATLDIEGFEIRPAKNSSSPNGIVLRNADGSVIRHCYIRKFKDGSGIVIENTNDVLIENNVFCGSAIGIECSDAIGTAIHHNSFNGHIDYGVHNTKDDPAFEVDASQNWWGDATGPGGVYAGLGDAVGENIDYTDWDAPVTAPTIMLTSAFVTGLSSKSTAYKGNTVDFVMEFLIEGGSDQANYIVKVIANSDFGWGCDLAQSKAQTRLLVGPGLHTATLRKKIPRCADDWTTGVSFGGVGFEMEGSWVDTNFRVTLQAPCEGTLDTDVSRQEAIFLVKKPF